MTPQDFAYHEYRDFVIYSALLKSETNPDFRRILSKLVEHEKAHFEFWRKLSPKKEFKVSALRIFFFKFVRKILGLTFLAKYMELHERRAIENYSIFLREDGPDIRNKVREIIEHEKAHEYELINQIKDEKVKFISNIVLGLNDGLVELTGALVGFSFALVNIQVVALAGFIMGVAASLSMASSAYLQARNDKNKGSKEYSRKAALYTGIAYFIVVLILIAPFLFTQSLFTALGIMGLAALLIITAISYYTSIIFERDFKKQFGEMLFFSVGVAVIAFLIGSILRRFINGVI